ncbi:MAG: M56 family metallopeptidase, partial [Lachnospiraceae bacterium]|nr:M56 family metallopeptidase [Lachnospiraceae bacterium]
YASGVFSYLFFATPTIDRVVRIFLGVWCVGVFLVLGAHLSQAVRTERRYRRARLSCDHAAEELFQKICRELGIMQSPELYQSYVVTVPMQVGVIHPVIYLPVRSWEEHSLRIVLLHELNHYRQRDVLVKWLTILVVSLHWFNPAAWILQRKLIRWSEYSCDLLCVGQCGEAKKYFQTILEMAERRGRPARICASALFEDQSELERRIRQVKKNRGKVGKGWISALLIAGILVASTVSVCAATTVAAHVYYDVFQATDEAVEEELDPIQELTEYTDNGPAENILEEEGEVTGREKSGLTSFEWTVTANTSKTAPAVYVASGKSIFISCTLDNENQSVRMGIIDSSNNRRYVIVKSYGSHSFAIKESGSYRVFIENTNESAVDVYGSYKVTG